MPPARARAFAEEPKPEARDRPAVNTATGTSTRPRKNAATAAVSAASNKDAAIMANGGAIASRIGNGAQVPAIAPGITWTAEDASLLHAYRNAYGLSAPPAFHSALNAAVLTAPGIGRHSPTMARHRDKRKVHKDTLALAVKKHFNGQAVNETDVVVDFLYAVKTQDKGFKVRFASKRPR